MSTILGPYHLTERIGQDGMATLHRAARTGPGGFEKSVVVRLMLPALARQPELVARFTAQARVAAQLGHAGLVQVYDFGVDDAGVPYVVRDDVDGITLAQLMGAAAATGRRLPVDVAAVVATELCQALGYAHRFRDRQGVKRRIVCGDLAPDKVLVGRDGAVRLADLGVTVTDEAVVEAPLRGRGQLAYAAPEQINRVPFDRRADVFAAGAMLHEMLTGRGLFAAASDLDTVRRIDGAEVAPPSASNVEVSLALDAVTLRALARDPEARFDDAAEMAEALQAIGHFGSGRRRVAELLADVLPEPPRAHCEACSKPLVPVLMCLSCDGAAVPAPRAVAMPAEPLVIEAVPAESLIIETLPAESLVIEVEPAADSAAAANEFPTELTTVFVMGAPPELAKETPKVPAAETPKVPAPAPTKASAPAAPKAPAPEPTKVAAPPATTPPAPQPAPVHESIARPFAVAPPAASVAGASAGGVAMPPPPPRPRPVASPTPATATPWREQLRGPLVTVAVVAVAIVAGAQLPALQERLTHRAPAAPDVPTAALAAPDPHVQAAALPLPQAPMPAPSATSPSATSPSATSAPPPPAVAPATPKSAAAARPAHTTPSPAPPPRVAAAKHAAEPSDTPAAPAPSKRRGPVARAASDDAPTGGAAPADPRLLDPFAERN